MSTPVNEEEIAEQISQHLDAAAKCLFGAVGGPPEALEHALAAQALAKNLSGTTGDQLSKLTDAYQHFVLGFTSLAKKEDLGKALEHFLEAKKLARSLKELYPADTNTQGLLQFELGVEQKILEVKIASAQGAELEQLTAKRDEIMKNMVASLAPDDPSRHFFAGLTSYMQALQSFEQSSTALVKLNLEDASQYIEEANALMKTAQESFGKFETAPFALQNVANMVRGFGKVLAAQEAYVRTLYDAVVGEVREHHLASLKAADKQLLEGHELIEKSAPVMMGQIGALFEFPLESVTQSINFQREVILNLRHLVERGLDPKEITRRASSRFLIYFVLTFLVVLFGSRFSGLVTSFSGNVVVSILFISLLVSVIASYGYEVGLKFASALKIQFGSGGGAEGSKAKA